MIIMHEMVHIYLGLQSLHRMSRPPETYGQNGVTGLRPQDTIRNPDNFAIYAAMVEWG